MTRLDLLAVAATAALASVATAQLPNYAPTAPETVLNTDFTQITPVSGAPFNVAGGVFVFNDVTIGAGKTVSGVGSRPMIWICNTMRVDGALTVRGTDGHRVDTLGGANLPVFGGAGGPAAGRGGFGSPQMALQSITGQPGNGPGNSIALGGGGGVISWLPGCNRGSAGGGGAFATNGDPWFTSASGAGTSFAQRAGVGGFGCVGASGTATRSLQGGGPGGSPFIDARADNNFFGLGYDVASGQFVPGELTQLFGGAGGGGGGNLSNDGILLSPNYANDSRGGGGGGGGGCLVIFALQQIVVGQGGSIVADGGHGGGGEQVGSCNKAGGGGAGSGGLLILATRGQIELHVQGETYANNDYDFVLSADGGVCLTGSFAAPVILGKYPANGQATVPGMIYDTAPLGGFGGMGIVQLAAPTGSNADGTNTVLDDNIVLIRNGVPQTGNEKRRFLAWRGFQNAQGVFVDDAGVPTNIGNNEGDIRPAPILLPIF